MAGLTRREFTRTMASGLLGAAMVGAGKESLTERWRRSSLSKRPNFVFVCSDQHAAKYCGYTGHPLVRTPNLDRIARNGIALTSAYCGSPLCVPSRSSMMTGMYASDVNSFCNSTVYDGSYPTWGKKMRESGYHCWAVGKQDLNPAFDLGFIDAGVDHGHAKKPDITSLFRRPVGYRIGEREDIDGLVYEEPAEDTRKTKNLRNSDRDRRDTEVALKFLRSETVHLKMPWVAFVGMREPHPPWAGLRKYYDYYLSKVQIPQVSIQELEQLPLPYQVMRNFKRISTPIPEERMRRAIAAYFSMISELDDRIGEIYGCLEETNQLENTYFIYTSDHGESLGEHGMWLKNNLYEGSTRVPLLISGPGLSGGTSIDTPIGHVDLVATMLELAGIQDLKSLRGTSLVPIFNGNTGSGPGFVYSESHSEGNPTGSCMIRKGEWKLIHFSHYPDLLFNVRDDPQEEHNRIGDQAVKDILKDLQSTLHRVVDPEEVTERAFALQQKVLDNFVDKMNEEELVHLLSSRMGDGQARVIAKMLKDKKK